MMGRMVFAECDQRPHRVRKVHVNEVTQVQSNMLFAFTWHANMDTRSTRKQSQVHNTTNTAAASAIQSAKRMSHRRFTRSHRMATGQHGCCWCSLCRGSSGTSVRRSWQPSCSQSWSTPGAVIFFRRCWDGICLGQKDGSNSRESLPFTLASIASSP